jgi:DNA-binding NtrC family response regulator
MGRDDDEDTTNVNVASFAEEAAELCALVSVDGVVSTHAFSSTSLIEIGRNSSCDLVIDHPSVSRHHATLQVSPLMITDLRSRNGIRMRGELITPGAPLPIAIGEAVQIGHATLLIHHKRLVLDAPAVHAEQQSSEALVRQLEIECARSARSGSPFAYGRVRVLTGAVSYEHLRATLRMTDVVAENAGMFEVLLPDTSSEQAAGAIARVQHTIAQHEGEARIAVARYPYDGTTAEALIARVWEQLDAPLPKSVTEMDAVRALITQVAGSDVSVLISGETGVGKELCAEMIHRQSKRAARPFVKLNCSAITESLIDSELFGHERGAFTGATTATPGLFEAGDGGTVFLDEIGELPLPAQAKLLRVLEERVVRRVGATAGRTLDVRFICATNRQLADEIDAGRFRRDLYYRINGVTITIPPLRERPSELAGLARAFASRPRGNATPTTLSDDVIAALHRHPWPGNIRELRNTIDRAMLFAAGGPVLPSHLTLVGSNAGRARGSVPTMPIERISEITVGGAGLPPVAADTRLADTLADVERRKILDAMDRCGGNQTRAAKLLGISRNTLLARLDSYGLPRPRKT